MSDIWIESAACADKDPDLFFPSTGKSERPAKRICATCPVRVECLEAAMVEEAGIILSYRFGVRGGYGPRDRFKLEVRRTKIARAVDAS